MNKLLLIIILCSALSCNRVPNLTSDNPKIASKIFDGTSLAGWEGPEEFFRVEDQAIVAGSLKKDIPMNQFLCTLKSYTDFDLTMKVKFTSTKNNAGIQFRSVRIPNNHEVIGYQADVGTVDGKPIWGSLYDESRRNKFMAMADSIALPKALNSDGWNDYRIKAKGNDIEFWINSISVLSYTELDSNINQSGKICVQIHGGEAAEAWYKDIMIIVLN